MSLFDSMKSKLRDAGKGAQKLGRIGQLKMDLLSAEGEETKCFTSLGKACANRFLERKETLIERSDSVIAQYLEDLRDAQKRVTEVKRKLEEARAS